MKILTIILLSLVPAFLTAQDTIRLFDCHVQVEKNTPRFHDRDAIREMGELQIEQARSAWYPSLDLNGKLTYQSDVVTVALTDPGIPVSFPDVPHDQYGLNLDITQTIYNGGITRQKKEYENTKTAADLQQVEVDLYSLKNRVNGYFYSVLLLQENLNNLELHLSSLEARHASVATAIEQGSVLESEIKVIDVEILRLRQSQVELESKRSAMLKALNILCGTEYTLKDVFILPRLGGIGEEEINRPESRLFELQDASMEAGKELLEKKRMPVLYAFGQTGYGNPGYNMFSGEWDFYYMVGAGLKWNLWDWNSTNREKQIIEKRQWVLRNRNASFHQEIESMLVQEEAKIEQYRKLFDLEERVLELRTEIAENAATKLAHGTITASEYVTELNKESSARINLVTHEILLNQSITNYLTIQGNL